MSRIGKLPITIPANVEVGWTESEITVRGEFGALSLKLDETIHLERTNNILRVKMKRKKRIKAKAAFHGLYRTIINNMIIGVSEQFELTLILKGVGYKALTYENEIILTLGYSHPIVLEIPEEISVEIIQNTTINLKSCDKQAVGFFAAEIRAWRRPEPYKGKGIFYKDEQIIRKDGKSAK